MAAYGGWIDALLKRIGAPSTPSNRAFLVAWQAGEGGGARFNPLNTTRHGYSGESDYNSVGVKNYTNAAQGAQALADTLNNGHYNNIVSALKKGNVSSKQLAAMVVASPWGTKHFPTLGNLPAARQIQVQGSTASAPVSLPGSDNPTSGLDTQRQLLSMLMARNDAAAAGKPMDSAASMGSILKLSQEAHQVSSTPVVVDPAAQQEGVSPHASNIVGLAKKYLGTKYVFGGAQPGGFDCSGFVQYLYHQKGINLPRTTFDQIKVGQRIDKQQLQPGDIVFFNTENDPRGPSHEGLYIGGNQFIQSPHTGDVVKISSMSDPYYAQRFVGARRVSG